MEQEEKTMDVTVVEEKVSAMEKMVDETKIASDKDLEAVADKIKNVKMLGKWIRQQMELTTKPAREIIKVAQEKYLPYEKACKSAEGGLKIKAEKFMAEQEAKRRAKEESIAKRAENGRLKEVTALRKMEEVGEEKKSINTGSSTITRKMVKQAEIVDPTLVPKEYWIIDEARVKKAALAGAIIPGVEVKEVPQMSVR